MKQPTFFIEFQKSCQETWTARPPTKPATISWAARWRPWGIMISKLSTRHPNHPMSDRSSSHTITNHIKFHPLSKLTITLQGSYQLINPRRSKPNAMLANYATWNGNKHIRTCLPNHGSQISYWHAVLTPATKNRSETQHFLHELRPASNLSPQKNTTEKVHVW